MISSIFTLWDGPSIFIQGQKSWVEKRSNGWWHSVRSNLSEVYQKILKFGIQILGKSNYESVCLYKSSKKLLGKMFVASLILHQKIIPNQVIKHLCSMQSCYVALLVMSNQNFSFSSAFATCCLTQGINFTNQNFQSWKSRI